MPTLPTSMRASDVSYITNGLQSQDDTAERQIKPIINEYPAYDPYVDQSIISSQYKTTQESNNNKAETSVNESKKVEGKQRRPRSSRKT